MVLTSNSLSCRGYICAIVLLNFFVLFCTFLDHFVFLNNNNKKNNRLIQNYYRTGTEPRIIIYPVKQQDAAFCENS